MYLTRTGLPTTLAVVAALLHLSWETSAQCPEFTASDLSSVGCFNGGTPCDLCPGESFQLTAEGTLLPNGGCVNWYYDTSPGFDPYAGEGTLIGCGSISAPPPAPCSTCPEILAIWIDACGLEQANEFMILSSGSGFQVNNLGIDFDPSNNGMSPTNEDINTNGGGCNWMVPNPSLVSAIQASANCNSGNVIAAGPGATIPAEALVIVFTSSAASTSYNFDALCQAGHILYIMQNACPRTIGAFSNSSSSGDRTTSVVLNNCNCSHSITHDTDDPALLGDGDYAWYNNGSVEYGNSGCGDPTPPLVEPAMVDYPPAVVQPVNFTVTDGLCNGGPYYVVGILDPLAGGCPEITTDEFIFDVPCPQAGAAFLDLPCEGTIITLQGSGGITYQWSGPNGFNATGETVQIGPLTPAHVGLYSVTVTNAAGCTDLAQASFSLQPEVFVALEPQSPVFCEGASAFLSALAQGGSGGYSFGWETPNGPQSGQSILMEEGGIYLVTVTDGVGCTDTASVTAIELEAPDITIQPDPAGFCAGGQVELSAVISGGAGGNQMQWTDPAGNPFNTPTHWAASPGVYEVMVTDQAGCSGISSIVVTEFPTPAVTLQADPPALCAGAQSLVTASGSGGTGGYLFSWVTPAGPASGNPLTATTPGTYAVTLTDAAGCTAMDSIVLVTGVDLIVSISPDPATFCPGGSVLLEAIVQGDQGGALAFMWDTPAGPATGNILNTALAGMYSVTVTEENGCSGTAQVTVSENAQLSIAFTADSVWVCAGGQALLEGQANGGDGNYTYTWSHPGGPTPGDSLWVSDPGVYLLEAMDGNGCSGLDSVHVLPAAVLPVFIMAGMDSICPGQSTTLQINPVPDPGWTVQWTGPSGTSGQYPLGVTVPGLYVVEVIYGAGCVSRDSVIIAWREAPLVTIVPPAPTFCTGSSVQLSVTSVSGGSPVAWSWSTPSGPASGVSVIAGLAGLYSVTVTDGFGCTSTAATTVTISPVLPVQFPVPTVSICAGTQAWLIPETGGGQPPFQYAWGGPAGPSTADTLQTSIPGIYTVTVTDAGGCTGTASVTVVTGSTLPVTLGPSNPGFCPGQAVELVPTVAGGQPPMDFAWTLPDGSASTDMSLMASMAGLYVVSVTDAAGCHGTVSAFVAAWDAPAAAISPAAPAVCPGQLVPLSGQATGGLGPYAFVWTGPSGQVQGPQVPGASAGSWMVTVTDSRGCTGTASSAVVAAPPLVIGIDPPVPAICDSASVTVTASVSSGNGPFSFVWSGPGDTLDTNPVSISQPGMYDVVVTDASGCSGSLAFDVAQLNGLEVTITTSVLVACGDTPYTATAQVIGGQMPLQYDWSTPSGPSSQNPVTVSGSGIIQLQVTDTRGCSGSATAEVAGGALVPDIEILPASCPGASDGALIIHGLGNGQLPAQVQVAGQLARQINGLPYTWPDLAPGNYILSLSDAQGCAVTQHLLVGVGLDPELWFEPAVHNMVPGGSVLLDPGVNFSPVIWMWDPPAGLSCSDCRTPVAMPGQSTVYSLTATDDQGCAATATVTIQVVADTRVYIPGAFSPNEDGINDYFFVQAADPSLLVTSMRIYDRWGNALFETFDVPANDAFFGWSGKYRGKILDPAVYVYVVVLKFADGQERLYRGEITLMR